MKRMQSDTWSYEWYTISCTYYIYIYICNICIYTWCMYVYILCSTQIIQTYCSIILHAFLWKKTLTHWWGKNTSYPFNPSRPRVSTSSCPGAKRPPEHSTVETPVPQSSWNLGGFLGLQSATQIWGGWFSWFQPILKIWYFPHKKGPIFGKGNESWNPNDIFFMLICPFAGGIGPSWARRNGNWWFVMPKVWLPLGVVETMKNTFR